MIKKVRIKNFKCYGPQGADFNLSKINFIFGDNSAGKSTFLQFLDKIYAVCKLDGRCDSKVFNKYLFKHQGGAMSAKFRVLTEGSTVPVEEVWSFEKINGDSNVYQLTDSNGDYVGLDQLSKVLPAKKHIVHVAANRKNVGDEFTGAEAALEKFQKDAERLVEEEALALECDGLNEIFLRFGIPYSCVVTDKEGVSRGMIHDNDFDMDLRLSEVGTGIEGLVELAMTLNAWEGGLLALEEPETNVNEGQMAALAKVLVEEALKRKSGQLIVECHSKIMALQLVEMVRNGLLVCGMGSKSNLSVLVVRKSVDGARIDEVKIDQNGDVDWPMGFFPAEGKLLRASYGIL